MGCGNYSQCPGALHNSDEKQTNYIAKFREKVYETAKYIIFNMRDHILKENYILYRTTIESINEKETWLDRKHSSMINFFNRFSCFN